MAHSLIERWQIDEDAPDEGARIHEWTADEVYRAMAAGVFGGRPVDWLKMELIEGELIEKMPQNRPHSVTLALAAAVLGSAFGPDYYIAQQVPLHIDAKSEPEPDIMVVAGSPRDYKSHPRSKDTSLVLEISDTTLRQDRYTKSRLYARAGVREYWILILKTRVLEVRRYPAPSPENEQRWEYQTVQVLREEADIAPLFAPDSVIRVVDLLPDAE